MAHTITVVLKDDSTVVYDATFTDTTETGELARAEAWEILCNGFAVVTDKDTVIYCANDIKSVTATENV